MSNAVRLQPPTPQAMAELLGQASSQRKRVMPVGGETRLSYGNPVIAPDWIVSTTSLNQILDYEPDDMTISVGAGVTLAELHDLLASKGQAMPIETWDSASATIGGIAAAAIYGPRRFGSGTLRDYLIGIEAAYPNGTVAKAGGMVVKNVSGFDMMRMLHGSLGTLAIITSINLKVIPAARTEATLIAACTSLAEASRVSASILTSALRPISLEVRSHSPGWAVAARFEGRPATVQRVMTSVKQCLSTPTTELGHDDSEMFWSHNLTAFTARGDEPYIWLRVRALPSESVQTVDNLAGMLPPHEFRDLEIRFNPALGSIDFKFARGRLSDQDLVDTFGLIRHVYPRTTVMTAPLVVRSKVDAFGEGLESVDLMRRMKQEFDPTDTLNPGRLLERQPSAAV